MEKSTTEQLKKIRLEHASDLIKSGIPQLLLSKFSKQEIHGRPIRNESIPVVLGSCIAKKTLLFIGLQSQNSEGSTQTQLFLVGTEADNKVQPIPNTPLNSDEVELIREKYYELKNLVDQGAQYNLENGIFKETVL